MFPLPCLSSFQSSTLFPFACYFFTERVTGLLVLRPAQWISPGARMLPPVARVTSNLRDDVARVISNLPDDGAAALLHGACPRWSAATRSAPAATNSAKVATPLRHCSPQTFLRPSRTGRMSPRTREPAHPPHTYQRMAALARTRHKQHEARSICCALRQT